MKKSVLTLGVSLLLASSLFAQDKDIKKVDGYYAPCINTIGLEGGQAVNLEVCVQTDSLSDQSLSNHLGAKEALLEAAASVYEKKLSMMTKSGQGAFKLAYDHHNNKVSNIKRFISIRIAD